STTPNSAASALQILHGRGAAEISLSLVIMPRSATFALERTIAREGCARLAHACAAGTLISV
ncbi:hypothetical protein, partial [Bradyrhizobium japonicum]|uniref:hypothetical protein n=1 Tax=Bradyrhizobium japonicum TaxID=375 RepID=UPI001AEC635A